MCHPRPESKIAPGTALPRCPFFFKRRMYSKAKGLRLMAFKLSLPMTGNLSRTAVLTLKL